MTRKLQVDVEELALALNYHDPEMRQYLDLETGDIIPILYEFEVTLEEIYDEIWDLDGNLVIPIEQALEQRDDLEWQKEMILEADRIQQGLDTRYVLIESEDSHEAYRDMERFIATVEDERLQEQLGDAIRGRGAFRRFKDMVARYPQVQEAWYAFKDARERERALDWLEMLDIEPL